jgi:4'-phosphopantetheinyl transferase
VRQGIVVTATAAEVLAAMPGVILLLTAAERSRARALRHSRDRDGFVAAHALARACAARMLGLPFERLTWEQRCPECGGPHGRPSIAEAPDLGLSLAHASGYVAAAAATGRVGVDVEPARNDSFDDEMARSVLTERELEALARAPDRGVAFLRQWVRREALVKVGALTLDTLQSVDFSHLPDGEPPGGWATHCYGDLHLADWRVGPAIGAVASQVPVTLEPAASVFPVWTEPVPRREP